ncbi:MAG: putative bifunctional diguanylate cyclase/phosphodiesterase [Thiohalomonadaceae bacterium]
MNLRLRTLTITAIALVAMFTALYFASSAILLKGFAQLEQQHVETELARSVDALNGGLRTLEEHVQDWAFWDESYAFMVDGNEDYRRATLLPSHFAGLRVDLIVYLRPGGDALFAGGHLPGATTVFPLSRDTVAQLAASVAPYKVALEEHAKAITGYALLNGRVVMLAFAPILTSDQKGPSRGVLVMGRQLSPDYLRGVATAGGPRLSLALDGVADEAHRVQVEGPDLIAGYVSLPGLSGAPVGMLRAEMTRDIFRQGEVSRHWLLVSLVIAGVAFLVVVTVVLDRLFLSRLARIDKAVTVIRQERDRTRRLKVQGTDELERLAATINETLDALASSEEQLRHEALHDPLTGLANRVLFTNRLETALKKARRNGYRCAVLLVDLDHFKLINDSFGHSIGDQFLLNAALRMGGVLRSVDTVARLGGDEFGILLDPIDNDAEASRCAERIVRALDNPVTWQGHQLHVTASIGIAIYDGGDTSPEDLLRDADTAMYRAKQKGRNGFALFDEAMHAQVVTRLELENDLRRAIAADELRAWYQPCFDLRTGALCGFEALVRWQHPRRGLLMPDEFVPLAESAGLVRELDHWMLRHACAALARWPTPDGRPPLTVSVNLSCRQDHLHDIIPLVRRVLEDTGLPGARIGLEVTEGALALAESELVDLLFALKRAGIRIYLDDFGTGYSSLSRLHRLPIDVLKIDRSFVADIERGDTEVASTIVTLAHSLGMQVVAEGIETRGQIARLRDLGCEFAQGFLFSRPLSEADVVRFITEAGRAAPVSWQRVSMASG